MKIAVLGATGNIGSRITAELAARGHAVSGFARSMDGKAAPKGATLVAGSVADEAWLASALKGFDAVVSALHFETIDEPSLVATVKEAGVPRVLVVGGAASLYLPNGTRLIDSPDFPEQWYAMASRGVAFIDALHEEKDLDWTFLSPSALIEPGERTGKFRLGGTELLVDAKGNSRISYEDYAVAMTDEVERPAHSRRQFTVGY